MSSNRCHPRRKPAAPAMTPSLADSFQNLSLCKGSTFHSPTSNRSELFNPFTRNLSPSLPHRSVTCPQTLEDLLIGAGERRAAELLSRVDEAIAKQSALSSILTEPEVLPVPRFMLEHTSLSEDSASNKQEALRESEQHRHASDSGIGSSVADSDIESSDRLLQVRKGMYFDNHLLAPDNKFPPGSSARGSDCSMQTSSAVTSSFSTTKSRSIGSRHCLSEFAKQQIHKYIIEPILKEQTLKEFHPLIQDVPRRIASKEITNLRDLEKTLIFVAPVSLVADRLGRANAYWSFWFQDFSRSPAAYQSFCETSIRCLHLTVDGVHESDQRLPSDRPYTNHYFVDLVEQIRRYAAILAANREAQATEQGAKEKDANPYVSRKITDQSGHAPKSEYANSNYRGEKLELMGGMSHTGKPAFLARKQKDGSYISLATNQPLSADEVAASSMKRPMEDGIADDDAAHRSMARRKKGELPKTYTCKSAGCRKEFKRPCDLTKHIKTHERPWKCPEADCKYHEYGWPTEKERERHVNDRHSNVPNLYKCLFEDCPYTSKRESNCKQHMEKSHGWEYVRSKNNGKGKAVVTHLPKSSLSPDMEVTSTPFSSVLPSPSMHSPSNGSASPPGKMGPPANTGSDSMFGSPAGPPLFGCPTEFDYHFNPDYLSAGLPAPYTPALSDDRRTSLDTSASDFTNHTPLQQPGDMFDDIFKPNQLDMAMFADPSYQQLTPATSYNTNSAPHSAILGQATFQSGSNSAHDTFSPHVSPLAHDLTLTSPHFHDTMDVDEGFADLLPADEDFQLFAVGPNSTEPLFVDQSGFGNMGSQFGYGSQSSNLLDLFPELKGQSQY